MRNWGLLVEGHGEVRALPTLLRRLIPPEQLADIELMAPLRQPRSAVVLPTELEKAVEFLRHKVGANGALLVLLDANGDLPCKLGPELLARCRAVVSDIPLSVVLAKCEFEAWFLGAVESLRGVRGINNDAVSPLTPESIRGAKERLSELMEHGRAYRPTVDQAALAAQFDYDTARTRCPSLDKLLRDVNTLLSA